jgi:hypothetical protein
VGQRVLRCLYINTVVRTRAGVSGIQQLVSEVGRKCCSPTGRHRRVLCGYGWSTIECKMWCRIVGRGLHADQLNRPSPVNSIDAHSRRHCPEPWRKTSSIGWKSLQTVTTRGGRRLLAYILLSALSHWACR